MSQGSRVSGIAPQLSVRSWRRWCLDICQLICKENEVDKCRFLILWHEGIEIDLYYLVCFQPPLFSPFHLWDDIGSYSTNPVLTIRHMCDELVVGIRKQKQPNSRIIRLNQTINLQVHQRYMISLQKDYLFWHWIELRKILNALDSYWVQVQLHYIASGLNPFVRWINKKDAIWPTL